MEQNKNCSNTHPCTCPEQSCPRHGKCCDCVAHHLKAQNLPMCMRHLQK